MKPVIETNIIFCKIVSKTFVAITISPDRDSQEFLSGRVTPFIFFMQYQPGTECHPFIKVIKTIFIFVRLDEGAEGGCHAFDELFPVAFSLFVRVIGIGPFCHGGGGLFPGFPVVGIEADVDVDVQGVRGQVVLDVRADIHAILFYGIVSHPLRRLIFCDALLFHADALPDGFHAVVVVPVCRPGDGAGALDVTVCSGDGLLFLLPIGTDPVVVGCPFPQFCVGPRKGVFLPLRFVTR